MNCSRHSGPLELLCGCTQLDQSTGHYIRGLLEPLVLNKAATHVF